VNIFQHNRTRLLFAGVVASLFLTGCNWVDSAGGGGSGGTGTEITLDAIPLGGAAAVLEETTPRIKVARQSLAFDRAYRFDETPSLEGALDACLSLDGFDADRAADTLTEACSSAEDECRFVVESDVTNSDELAFTLGVPTLRAPVGRRHTLSTGREVVAEDGSVSFVEEARRDIDFCLLSMNEAPDAGDDTPHRSARRARPRSSSFEKMARLPTNSEAPTFVPICGTFLNMKSLMDRSRQPQK